MAQSIWELLGIEQPQDDPRNPRARGLGGVALRQPPMVPNAGMGGVGQEQGPPQTASGGLLQKLMGMMSTSDPNRLQENIARKTRMDEMRKNWTNRPNFQPIGGGTQAAPQMPTPPRMSAAPEPLRARAQGSSVLDRLNPHKRGMEALQGLSLPSPNINLPEPGEEQIDGETYVDMSPWEQLQQDGAYQTESADNLLARSPAGPARTGSSNPTRAAAIQAAVGGQRRSQTARPKAPASPLASSNPLSMAGLAPSMEPDDSPIASSNPLSALMVPPSATQGYQRSATPDQDTSSGEKAGGRGMDLLRVLGPVLAAIFYGRMLKR